MQAPAGGGRLCRRRRSALRRAPRRAPRHDGARAGARPSRRSARGIFGIRGNRRGSSGNLFHSRELFGGSTRVAAGASTKRLIDASRRGGGARHVGLAPHRANGQLETWIESNLFPCGYTLWNRWRGGHVGKPRHDLHGRSLRINGIERNSIPGWDRGQGRYETRRAAPAVAHRLRYRPESGLDRSSE